MSAHPLTPHQPRPALLPGQRVHVNTHAAAWMPATVLTVAHARVGIALHTGQGLARRTVAPWLVAPADGLHLAAVREVREGDQVAGADGTRHTVATAPWRGGDGWWVLAYTSGQQAVLPPGTVLRLADPTTAADPCLGLRRS
ncbi:MAG TPA: hypothetical protein VH561_13850 [Micromonosporaceae bacterium]|jgi:hypothetical protein